MGYYESLYSEQKIEVAALPDWFKTMLHSFFADKFIIFGKILDFIKKPDFFKDKNLNHTAIVSTLLPKISAEVPTATADDIFEMLSFLEKKEVITDGLTRANETIADDFLNKINTIRTNY